MCLPHPCSDLCQREVPRKLDEWRDALGRWRSAAGELGDPLLEWLLWQTLVGAWPLDAARLSAYLAKAAREAGLRTTWTDVLTGTAHEAGPGSTRVADLLRWPVALLVRETG